MSKTIYSLIGVTAVSVAVLNIPATTATSASSQAQASVNVHTTCSMTATVNTAHNATLVSGTYSSGDYPDGIGKTTIQTFCNDQGGYAIYAIGFTNNQLGSTVLKGASLSSDYDIATGTATSGDTSNWAMKISAVSGTYAPTVNNGYSSFSTVPSSWTKVASLTSSTDSTSTTNIGSKIETTYAAYISNAQPAGTYSGQVKYALVHPSVTPESYVMQDVADWGNNLLPGVQYNVTDSRDGKEYTVALLEDGNVWMTKNLDLAGGTTLTPADSNVTSNYTLPASSTTGFDDNFTAYVYNSNSTTCGEDQPCYSYYSYVAATAGTNPFSGEAASDICPKGWRLPTSAEYATLKTTYTTGATLTAAPWYGVYSGYYNDTNSFSNGGTSGGYWSSTLNSTTTAAPLLFYSSSADMGNNNKYFGFSVRCIKDNTLTMQEVTTAQLNTLLPNTGDTMTLKDSRDNQKYTVGKLADGNVWLLDNLALDLTNSTVKANLSASNTNASATTLNYLKNGGGTASDKYAMIGVTSTWSTSQYYYSAPRIAVSGTGNNGDWTKDTEAALAMQQSGTGKIGVYYNYCAASAGSYCYGDAATYSGTPSGNATEDICPAGWRMPTGGDSGEYQALLTELSSDKATFVNTLRTPLSGYFSNGSAYNQSGGGDFWSSIRNDSIRMYGLYVGSSNVDQQDYGGRHYGRSIRCIKDTESMQEVTTAQLNSWLPNTGDTMTLKDSRDNQKYTVGKLADGNVWLLDNLALDLINVDLSDLQGKTNASNAALNYLKNGGGTTSDQYPTAGITTFTTADNFSIPNMIASGTCYDSNCVNDPTSGNWTKDSVVGTIANSKGYNKIGIYYNYCAASAGTYCWGDGISYDGSPETNPYSDTLINIDGDICPKGWRMPTSDTGSAPYGEYRNLYLAYSSNYTDFRRALSTPLSGLYLSGSARYQSGDGYFWSSTWYGTSRMRYLNVGASIDPSGYSHRNYGFSVRCIKDNTLTMQEVTTAQLNTLLPNTGDTMTLKDSRDNQKYTVGKLADGNVWLLDNLALDLINTDITDLKGKTNASDISLEYLKGIRTGTTSDQYPTAGVGTFTSSNEYSVPRISLADKDIVPQGSDPLASEALANNWKVGGYYNYCAASAGTYCWGNGTDYTGSPETDPNPNSLIDATEDICPRGWRMPTSTADGEYHALYSAYSGNYTNFRTALSTPLSGYYGSGSAFGQSGLGFFWSSTWGNTDGMRDLYMDTSNIFPSDISYWYNGFSVRCIKD